jgi:hypothetical protein
MQRILHAQNLRARTEGGKTKGLIHIGVPSCGSSLRQTSYTPLYDAAVRAVRQKGDAL